MSDIPAGVPGYMRSTVAMIMGAFPDGISEDDFTPLVHILGEAGMSERSIANALAAAYERDDYNSLSYAKYSMNVRYCLHNRPASDASIERVIRLLKANGFDTWLASE